MKTRTVLFVIAGLIAHAAARPGFAQSTTATPPTIATQPAALIVNVGATATFTATANGTAPLRFRWLKNDREIEGAEAATFTLSRVQLEDAAVYRVRVTNGAGTTTSAPAALTINGTPGAITTAPASTTARAGTDVRLAVTATGAALTYQWKYNGRRLQNATGATLTLANAGTTVDGFYEVTVFSRNAPVAASAAQVTITTDARLTNIATRGLVGEEDDEVLIGGFVTRGTGDKKVLVRAVGPTLATAPFNVTGVLTSPRLTLYRGGTTVATNAGWGGTAALSAAFTQVGAFPLPTTSADAALLQTLPGGGYTVHVTGPTGARGVALLEVYDADTGSPAVELANISTRAMVGAVRDGALIAGFVITGSTSNTILVRGVSQSLGTLYGMRRALGSSQVAVFDAAGRPIAANAIWSKPGRGNGRPEDEDDDEDRRSELEESATRTGAFGLPRGSTDSAVVLTLPPGAYTAQVTGRNNSSGVALVEIYEVR